jgi:FtsP/CotA-like multicopper oxidase with cupredoxin domain
MHRRKVLTLVSALGVIMAMTFQVGPMATATTPVPPGTTPHYFGPYPNWANSPLTTADAKVVINGDGTGAKAVATVDAKGVITGVTITDPGKGYTSATAVFSGSGQGASADVVVSPTGVVTGVVIDQPGGGYTKPKVTFSGGGAAGVPVTVGNALQARSFATDYATPPGTLGSVFVVVPTAMPASGQVTGISYFNQATTGGSPTNSEGNLFHAYVLTKTANPNEYTVAWDSGELTVPHTTDLVGVVETIPVPNIPVTTGDTIAFYGEGIPVDDVGTGSDTLVYPANTLPTGTIVVGDATFPVYSQTRTYSFGANVLDLSQVAPVTDATGTVFGGVDNVSLDNAGSGYHMPTVQFDLPDDPNGTLPTAHVLCTGDVEGTTPYCAVPANPDGSPGVVTIASIVVDTPGSGYSSAPGVAIFDGTQFDPILQNPTYDPPRVDANATATLLVQSVLLDTFGSGYASPPNVVITDTGGGTGNGAQAHAEVDAGAVVGIQNLIGGTGWLTGSGIKKFTDPLPELCDPDQSRGAAPPCAQTAYPNLVPVDQKQIPLAVADTTNPYPIAGGPPRQASDTYEIGLVQYRMQFSSSMPEGALVRGYVQLESASWLAQHPTGVSQHVELFNELKDGTQVSTGYFGVTAPSFLGPTIVASRDKPVRIVFRNLLPKGSDGDLFLPVDSTLMGSGMGPLADQTPPVDNGSVTDEVRNPMCTYGFMGGSMPNQCFTQNRATLHLHGGVTPWISDGTPHQWVTPANETTGYPQGVSVSNVPDMDVCGAENDGCQTFYYTNQQSARLMFYHDHAWGITRLNVYAGEAAGYVLTDNVEAALMSNNGPLAGLGLGAPLVIQDRTFVPDAAQLAQQDPTWDSANWGGRGSLWYHHVYMPAQNPGDPSGMSSFGRWMYGPWFWPPASPQHGPIDNPYYDPACDLNDPSTWQYTTDPFCEPALIPGTPNVSVGMEQFNDTPLVNGTAYPVKDVKPQSYRFRILNAANDRFWNLQWYIADDNGTPNDKTDDTEVALKASELAAAQSDPNVFPTPDLTQSPAGPDWIQIGNEGGFLPAPVVVDGQQVTTWITDPTRFDVGNVDQHSLLLAPAERADVIVDFSGFRGKTLILYNDAPAAFPARVSSYDYYTGDPDLSPAGAPSTIAGYGPNTRTIMRVNVADTTPAQTFNLTALNNAFKHHADGSGVFEKDQDPIIVGQAAYNSAYGTNFVANGWCNAPGLTGLATTRCDGYARINEGNHPTDLFGFNGLKPAFRPGTGKLQIPFQPKGLHDEMNSAAFDEFGRMTANLGLEAPNANPLLQNIILYPYVNPSTELIDATNLPQGDINMTPIASAADGTQIWKITHNGVDTHPIHWHLWNVQVLNRVTWDNIIIPPDPAELGWKETVRISPLEDTIVALRPIIPTVPFEVPNSVRDLNPMMPEGVDLSASTNAVDQNGNPTTPIFNNPTNFGWEYVYHCHILSHEEMDMMRPVSVMLPPLKPSGLTAQYLSGPNRVVLTWTDNSINETRFLIQRQVNGGAWETRGTLSQPLKQDLLSGHGVRTFTDPGNLNGNNTYAYRVLAQNVVGYGGAYMQQVVQSSSGIVGAPIGTTTVTSIVPGPSQGNNRSLVLTWTYAPDAGSTLQTGFTIQRATNPNFTGATNIQLGNVFTYTNTGLSRNTTYWYRVRAKNSFGFSAWSTGAVLSGKTLP